MSECIREGLKPNILLSTIANVGTTLTGMLLRHQPIFDLCVCPILMRTVQLLARRSRISVLHSGKQQNSRLLTFGESKMKSPNRPTYPHIIAAPGWVCTPARTYPRVCVRSIQLPWHLWFWSPVLLSHHTYSQLCVCVCDTHSTCVTA